MSVPAQRVVAAAVQTLDGVVHVLPRPSRHHHVLHALHRAGVPKTVDGQRNLCQGFLLSDGVFVQREQAARVAIAGGQIERLQGAARCRMACVEARALGHSPAGRRGDG